MNILKNRVAAVATGALLIAGLSATGGAYASGLIGSGGIQNDSVRSIDLKDGHGVGQADLKPGLAAQVAKAGTPGPKGDQGEPGADGKDGVSNLIAGAGYTSTWKAGQAGETIESCPEGQYALGGGFSTFGGDSKDLGGDNDNIQITVSAPYFEGEYKPVDDAGNFRPTEWVVRGFNHGDTDQVVRAWVTCATIAD